MKITQYHTRTPPCDVLQWQLKIKQNRKQNIFKEGGMGVFKIIEGWYRIFGAVGKKDTVVELVINSLLTYAA